MGCTIIGCGKQLPALDVPNEELTKLVDTSDEWISTRTGILSRRVCVGESNVDLAEGAARQALGWDDGGYSERSIAPEDIDLVIYSTITPDEVVPTCAAVLRRRLGLINAAAFDMNAACSGFIYGLTIAETMMAASAPGVAGAAGRNLAYAHVPAVFGLGILFDADAPWAAQLAQHVAPFHNNPLLASLEENRLRNYLKVIEMQDLGSISRAA